MVSLDRFAPARLRRARIQGEGDPRPVRLSQEKVWCLHLRQHGDPSPGPCPSPALLRFAQDHVPVPLSGLPGNLHPLLRPQLHGQFQDH